MTFDELVLEVYDITNRPDLISETKSAIKAATLKAHMLDYFSKDIYETGVEFGASEFRQSFDYISFIPNLRAFKFARRVTDENDEKGKFFEILKVEESLDAYGRNRSDIAYVAGRVLEIRSSVAFDKMLLGCYVLPIVVEADYSSWVADLYPYVVIYEAARVVFKGSGDKEQSSDYKDLVSDQYAELKIAALTDVGY